MSTVRFYMRRWDGRIEHDETYVIDTSTVERLEKSFTLLGDRHSIVVEFDPPLVVPRQLTLGEDEERG